MFQGPRPAPYNAAPATDTPLGRYEVAALVAVLGDTEAITRDIYAHLLPGDLDRSVQRLWTEVEG